MKKILFVGDSPACASGLGNVSRNLLNGLIKENKDIEVTVIGVNDFGGYKDPVQYPYKIYPAIYNDYSDLVGWKRLFATLTGEEPEIKEKFDMLIYTLDFFLLDTMKVDGKRVVEYLDALIPASGIKETVIYTPIDNDYLSKEWLDIFRRFDKIMVPSLYAKGVIEKYDPKLATKVHVIYYPVDCDKFFLINKGKAKKQIRKTMGIPTDAYVVGFVGRNQWRKDLYRLCKVFIEYKKINPKAFLYVHTDARDNSQQGWNLYEILYREGMVLGKDYLFPNDIKLEGNYYNVNKGVSRNSMNEIYNMMDVFVSTSTGEGFGLPEIEAMLAETPVIAPDNTTMTEFLENDRGYRYLSNEKQCFGYIDMMRERPLADVGDCLRVINDVHGCSTIDTKKTRSWVLDKCNPETVCKVFNTIILTKRDNK